MESKTFNMAFRKKIALFGGSFNPIHCGHMEIANQLIEDKVVDEVWFIPCGNHPFDKKLVNGLERINMINFAISSNPCFKLFDIELNKKEKSYTAETWRWFNERFNHGFYLIIGSDNLTSLDRWHDLEYIKNNVNFILVKRSGFDINLIKDLKIYYILNINNRISSTQVRENIVKGISISNLVPKKVEEYIVKEDLYIEKLYESC